MKATDKTRKRRLAHAASKNSPSSWLGEFIPLTPDEAVIYGPLFVRDGREYGETITHALHGRVAGSKVKLTLQHGKCLHVEVSIQHPFFKKTLTFRMPPMRAAEVVDRIWTAISTAMTRPNVDPVALARESLAYGTEDPESFSALEAAQD